MQLRLAEPEDMPFVVEMARLAGTLEDRPLPSPDAPVVIAVLPEPNATVLAISEDGLPVGAAWWHFHEPPLLHDPSGEPLPELVMAVAEGERGKGIGAALIDALADEASKHFSALTLERPSPQPRRSSLHAHRLQSRRRRARLVRRGDEQGPSSAGRKLITLRSGPRALITLRPDRRCQAALPAAVPA